MFVSSSTLDAYKNGKIDGELCTKNSPSTKTSTKKQKEEFIHEQIINTNAMDEKKLKQMMQREYNIKQPKQVD
eukprot:9908145-Ditylum_brightwellii.AAC.1